MSKAQLENTPFLERQNFLLNSVDLEGNSSHSHSKGEALSNSNKENSSSRVTEKQSPSLIDKSIEINFSSQRAKQTKPSDFSGESQLRNEFFKSSTSNLQGEIESPLIRLGNSQVSEMKNERSMSCFDNDSNKATPHSLNQSKEKGKNIGDILLAMSGQYYLANGSQTPNTYEQKINNRRYITSLSGSKEVKRKMKKNQGNSLHNSKSRKLPIYPSDSLFVEREDIDGIGRMQYTIKAYFPKKDQVKKFKHNI